MATRLQDPDTDGCQVRHLVPADVFAATQGDGEAAERVIRSLLPRVRNLVRYLAYRDRDVDDLAQDALVAIFRGLATYRGEGPFQSWCDRVVVRSTFAALRRRDMVVADGGVAAERSEATDGLQGMEYVARREVVRALDTLPRDQRYAVVLHHVLEMSVPEIAEQLELSGETVRSRLRLGRARLREACLEARASGKGER